MQHHIDAAKFGPRGTAMASVVQSCVHCGLCLPACPTYQVLGEEMDSPRGRIYLMKYVLEGELPAAEAQPYLDRCLGCWACVPACPSGVAYGELLTHYRAATADQRQDVVAGCGHTQDAGGNATLSGAIPQSVGGRPDRARGTAAAAGRLARHAGLAAGRLASVRSAARHVPGSHPAASPRGLADRLRAERLGARDQLGDAARPVAQRRGDRRAAHAGLLRRDPDAHGRTRAGPAVGSPQHASLSPGRGRHLDQRRGLRIGDARIQAAVCRGGGPGDRRAFAARVQDVSVFLDQLGLVPPGPLPVPLRVAYHDACHLLHAQGVRDQPRRLLAAVPNVELLELNDGGMCCGSAGVYNLVQPEIARQLGDRKVARILDTGADAVVTGNIGCLTQIQMHLRRQSQELPVYHTMTLLDRAYKRARDDERAGRTRTDR